MASQKFFAQIEKGKKQSAALRILRYMFLIRLYTAPLLLTSEAKISSKFWIQFVIQNVKSAA